MKKMDHKRLRELFSKFWEKRGHKEVPPIPLVPKDDPTTLFTGSGMQQLVPYLLGEPHPLGKRLYNIQRCFRSQDIEEVGDNRHTTFFEMMGNWSLGDYFKREQLNWFFEFLVEVLGFDPSKLYVTVFEGWDGLPADEESIRVWKEIFKKYGIKAEVGERIFKYPAEKNWWSRAGVPENMPEGEPGGPDSEVFYLFENVKHNPKFGPKCHPNCDCGRFLEIGNSVFMQYKKTKKGFEELPSKNVDFGGGLERILASLQDEPDIFKTELYFPIIKEVEKLVGKEYKGEENKANMRIIADHIKASVFLIWDGVLPSSKEQGYVLRRLLRRVAVKVYKLAQDIDTKVLLNSAEKVIDIYKGVYFEEKDRSRVLKVVEDEIKKFKETLKRGMRIIEKIDRIDGKKAFDLYQSYGFPFEIIQEIFEEKGQKIDKEEFRREFEKHKKISRKGAEKKFKGGLADHSEQTIKYHTATHLIHQALFDVLGKGVRQEGSNITAERLRFDFYCPVEVKKEHIEKVEQIVNQKIKEGLPVYFKIMPREEAFKVGAKAFFKEKYPEKVKVYFIGDYSKEFCGGPHVKNTKEIGKIKIFKFKRIGSNLYRLYAK